MRLVTYTATDGATALGVLDEAGVHDLRAADPGLPGSMLELLRAPDGMDRARAAGARAAQEPAVRAATLLAPLPRPTTLRDFMLVEEHVRSSFGEVPEAWYEIPVYWKGNPDTIFGPDAEVPWPRYTEKLDFELEVGAVLGRPAWRVTVEEAERCIAGYTIFNDWSARDIQFREMTVGLGPGLGKDFASSLGPCLTTPDAFDIATARVAARINGETWAEGDLGSLRFSFAEVISHLSQEQPLQPGDVLGSGTVGRGCGLELDRWIAPGDVVELEVSGIGVLRNTVGPRPAQITGHGLLATSA
jgi:2-keto-4-pentenoate hydratase/2-oxohepta-3-ene-1,7-dioic acid hydratase in catechol pathway